MEEQDEHVIDQDTIDIQKEKVTDSEVLAQLEAEEAASKLNTHVELDSLYVGVIEELSIGGAKTNFISSEFMKVDGQNMLFSGFVNAAAEYAAVCAVNDENTMVTKVKTIYFAPVRLGEEIHFEALVKHHESRKQDVTVIGYIEKIKVYKAVITVVITEYHPLQIKLMDVATS